MNVYQIQVSDAAYDYMNKAGREAAAKMFPETAAATDLMFFGAKSFTTEMFQYFRKVAVFETDDLEEAFTIGNIGPESKINRILPMHSLSVGDIVEKNGKFFMVDRMGFSEVAV